MKKIEDFNLKGKRVLVRCDFNVPLSKEGEIAKRASPSSLPSFPSEAKVLDDFRIRQTVPTIEYLLKNKAKIILISHLGKTGENKTLKPIAKKLEELLGRKVKFLNDCIGEEVKREIEKMRAEEIFLLENLRFYKEEEENDESFARKLADLGEIFINDAFGASHRNHASITGIPKFLPSGAGLSLEKEIKILSGLLKNPQKPLVTIIGGAKVEDKVKVIDKLSELSENVLIGGLIKREIEGKNISLKFPQKIILPLDEVEGKDIGPKTINLFNEKIKIAKTIFWNGPLGRIEEVKFQRGTEEIARDIIKSGAFSIAGGGETVEFINKLGLAEKFSHLSTGGGALLEFLAGEKLPGLTILE